MSPSLHVSDRTCRYCPPADDNDPLGNIDNEFHLFCCLSFANQQRCLFAKIGAVLEHFGEMSFINKVITMLCTTNAHVGRLVNKYISIIFRARDKIDDGYHLSTLTFPPMVDNYTEPSETDYNSESEASESDSESDMS